jgi:staphylococcal nuclease domain-containing protein 1
LYFYSGAGSTVPSAGSKSKDIKEVGYQFEAREYLRKRLIGKQVHVTIDYVKPAQDGFEEKECATVKIGDRSVHLYMDVWLILTAY